jgi:hypothetical protein
MRKRGLIVLAATLPAWIVFVYFGSEFEKENRVWGYEGSLPAYVVGAGLAIILATLVALALVFIDLVSWRRQLNDRTNKTN